MLLRVCLNIFIWVCTQPSVAPDYKSFQILDNWLEITTKNVLFSDRLISVSIATDLAIKFCNPLLNEFVTDLETNVENISTNYYCWYQI